MYKKKVARRFVLWSRRMEGQQFFYHEGVHSMELYQLKSFLAVARSGSLSRAAGIRNISLPGISKHIKMLEEQFGYSLFTRTVKGMELTDSGQQVLKIVERIQTDVDSLSALIRKSPAIRIGLNVAPRFVELFHLKELFEHHYPDSQISLTNQNSGALLESVGKGELDLCLAFGRIPGHFHKLLIREVRMPLMIPAALAESIHDLSRECWIINTACCPFKEPLEEFWRVHGVTPRSTILAQDLSRKELVAQGLGICFLEPQDALALIQSKQGRAYGEYFLEVPLWVVFQDAALQPKAERLQHYVQMRYDSLSSFSGNRCTVSAVEDLAN